MKLRDLIDLDVDVLIKTMRDSGIQHIRCGDTECTLSPMLPPVKEEVVSGNNWETEDSSCKCGHQSWEHNSMGECLHGCTDECRNDIKEEIS